MRPTHASHKLAEAVINDGSGDHGTSYPQRLKIAREPQERVKAYLWYQCARRGANGLERRFGDEFNACDILLAAAELCDYYEHHVAEVDAYDTAAGRGRQ